ncbi:RNA polymerase sporulation sigma factor SigK [Mycoplasmatota bacterium zrk1]
MIRVIHKILDFFSKKPVYFINSSDVLPEPLTAEEERKYVRLSQQGDKLARDKLIEHNLRLVVYIAKKFESTNIHIEDLIGIGSMGLIKAVKTFKEEKQIKLATYASRCIENEILMFLRKISKSRQDVSLDEKLNTDAEGNELILADILGTSDDGIFEKILADEERRAIYRVISDLPIRERNIVTLRFGLLGKKELTQKQVAKTLGISQSYISRLEKRIFEKIKHQVDKELQRE